MRKSHPSRIRSVQDGKGWWTSLTVRIVANDAIEARRVEWASEVLLAELTAYERGK